MLTKLLLKTMKKYKNRQKQDIHQIFIKTNWIKCTLNMRWFIDILRICLEEHLLKKCHDKGFKNIMNINLDLHQLFINVLIKILLLCVQINLSVVLLHAHGQRPKLSNINVPLKRKLCQTCT